MFGYYAGGNAGDSRSWTIDDFVQLLDRDIRSLSISIDRDFELHNPGMSQSQCQPLLTWLASTTTLRRLILSTHEGIRPMGVRALHWMLQALLNRDTALPAIPDIGIDEVDMTAEDMVRLVQVCRPERLMWTFGTIVCTTTYPTRREALEHIGTALHATSTTLKTLELSSHL
jgi:hypothetical protein